MRPACCALLLSAACGGAGPSASAAAPRDPAAIALPAVAANASVASAPSPGAAAAPARPAIGCDATFPTEGMTWREKHVTRVDLSGVASCQVQPMRRAHTTAFDVTLLEVRGRAATRVKLDILDDVDDTQGWPAAASLVGKHYVVAFDGPRSAAVTTADGAPVADEEAQRVRGLVPAGAVTALDPDLVQRLGRSRDLRGRAVAAVSQWMQGALAPSLRDEMPQAPSANATLVAGEGLDLDVSLATDEGSAGMCHRWSTSARMAGTLKLRPADGALVSLQVKGPAEDTEATCPAGGGTAPRACNRGEASYEIERPCFAGSGAAAAPAGAAP